VKLVFKSYVRSPDRNAHVCNLCENRDIQDEKHVIFPCMGTDIYGTVEPFI
jgi:hypothetical protein